MGKKLDVEDIREGAVMEATFSFNPVEDSGYRFKATHLDGKRAPKVVLCNDREIQPGVPCLVRVVTVRKRHRPDRGMIEVTFEKRLDFKLEGVYIKPEISRKLQILLESGLNIMLDGPQGCGKTVTARALAETLDMEFIYFNCGAVIEASDFLATIQVRASESGQPITDFVKTSFLSALEEAVEFPKKRYLLFLDELNRCPESARNALMPALDSIRRVFHPIENRFFEIPDNVQFIAAINRGREFSGTFGIDAAQLDRFAPLQMNYPPPPEEIRLLSSRFPDLSQNLLKRIVGVAHILRQAAELGQGLSVRATEEVCIYLGHPLMAEGPYQHLAEVMKSSYCGRFPGRWDDPTTDAGIAWTIVDNALKEQNWDKIFQQ